MNNFGGDITKRPRKRRRPRVTSVRVIVAPNPSETAESNNLGTICFGYLIEETLTQDLFTYINNYQISIAAQIPEDGEDTNLGIPVLEIGKNISDTPTITNNFFSYHILGQDLFDFFKKIKEGEQVNINICYNLEEAESTTKAIDAFSSRPFSLNNP